MNTKQRLLGSVAGAWSLPAPQPLGKGAMVFHAHPEFVRALREDLRMAMARRFPWRV